MSILDELKGDFETNKKNNVIKHDALDNQNFNEMRNNSDKLNESTEKATKEMSTADKLAEDIFYSLYKYDPKQHEEKEIKSQYKMNKNLIEKTMDTKEFETFRERTQMDEMQSAIGTISFLEKTLEKMDDEDIKKVNKKTQQLNKQQNELESLKSQLEGLDSIENKNEELEEQLEKKKEKLEKLKEKQEKTEEKLEQNMQNASSAMRQAAREGMKEAKKNTQNMEDMISGWGLGDNGDMKKLPLDKRIELAKELKDNEKLQKIAKMIGSMKRLSLSVRKNKVTKKPEEIQNITRGDDISRTLPDELGLLAMDDEITDLLFFKRKEEKELLQYELEGKEKKGKGPIIACVDTSGSMSGQKEIWGKGVAAGLFHIAKRENRDFIGILFSYSKESMKTYHLLHDDISKDEQLKRFKDFSQGFIGGNTDFEPPLKESIELISSGINAEKDYKQADIVFITDGQAKITDETKNQIEEIKDKIEFKIIGIGVESLAGGLEDFCDRIYSIHEIAKEGHEIAQETFHSIQ